MATPSGQSQTGTDAAPRYRATRCALLSRAAQSPAPAGRLYWRDDRHCRREARDVSPGLAGLSIEDATGRKDAPLYDLALSVERVRAASEALRGSGVLLTGRAEGYLVGRPVLAEVIDRLTAYAEAGADCLYAPGVRAKEEIEAIVRALAPRPVNVLLGAPLFTQAELAALGVRRISVGGALARVAWGETMRAARELASQGTFGGFARAAPFADLDGLFAGE